MLVCRVQPHGALRLGTDDELRCHRGRLDLDGRRDPLERSDRDAQRAVLVLLGRGGVVLEPRCHAPGSAGQSKPQLGAAQGRRGVRRDLGVGDAVAGGHQVELTGTHDHRGAEAVAVLELPVEEPAHRGQPDVRVGRQQHPAGDRHVVGPVVVDEAPRPHQGPVTVGQRAADGHGPRAAERNESRRQGVRHTKSIAPERVRGRRMREPCHSEGRLPSEGDTLTFVPLNPVITPRR